MIKELTIIFISAISICGSGYAQKARLDTGLVQNWNEVGNFAVTNDGRYTGHIQMGNLVLQSTDRKWTEVVVGVRYSFQFTQDSRHVIFQRNDTIWIINLDNTHDVQQIPRISSYQVNPRGRDGDILVYARKGADGETLMRDLSSGKETILGLVKRHWISLDGNTLLIESEDKEMNRERYLLNWLNIKDGVLRKIWEGGYVESNNMLMDSTGNECIFIGGSLSDSGENCIWSYTAGSDRVVPVIDNRNIEKGMHIGHLLLFNVSDKRVFFTLEERRAREETRGIGVDIWNYKDKQLQSVQLHRLEIGQNLPNCYKAVLNLKGGRILRLEGENEELLSPLCKKKSMQWVLIERNGGGDVGSEWNWNRSALQSIWLVSLTDGTRKLIDSALPSYVIPHNYVLSFRERYVYYYNYSSKNYYSYDIGTGRRRNLTAALSASWTEDYYWLNRPDSLLLPYMVAGCIRDGNAVLVYDRHDIYELDADKSMPVINLTGRNNPGKDLIFRLILVKQQEGIISQDENVLCSVMDSRDKRKGILLVRYDSLRSIQSFRLDKVAYYLGRTIRARDTAIYFVWRMTTESAPNVFESTDLQHYRAITDVHPEKEYNWMTSELINWKLPNGSNSQGILYKPEDFDANKKYPLLVFYYDRLSNGVYDFIEPGPSDGSLNIPFYVSHDYLVFEPDIHYRIGWPGKSALDAVVSGVESLSRRPYVDKSKIGLQGHSWGAYETNYIITHSRLFAAAMSACGVSDLISNYGSIRANGESAHIYYESQAGRIGATLWQSPRLYMENSPVLLADKVCTPLLMVANKNDGAVPYEQGVEFFTDLRRLGKKVWMLQYDGVGHTIDGKAREDLSIRMSQFFNYYLKGGPAPVWMTAGVPARLKGVVSGLEIDSSVIKP
jgi:dienelactone hydrolase